MAAFFAASTPSIAAEVTEDLLEKLRAKGVLTQQEYEQMRGEARSERRQRALREAQANERAEKDKEAAGTRSIGTFRDGFSFESGDKQHLVALTGRVQADYRSFDVDSTNANTANGFDVRRAYLGVSGRFYRDWTYDVTGNFAQGGSDLDVAWINYGGFQPAQIRFGQFKMPFSLEEQTSSRFIDFTERSFANALVPGKERGLMVHGTPLTGVNYGLALSNGQGNNANEPNASVDDPDVIGRVTANVAEMIGNKNAIIHLGAGFSTGTLPSGTVVPSLRTEGRGLTLFNAAASTGEVDRDRTGIEVALALNQFKLQGEWVRANFSGTSGAGVGFDRDMDAAYYSFHWLIPERGTPMLTAVAHSAPSNRASPSVPAARVGELSSWACATAGSTRPTSAP